MTIEFYRKDSYGNERLFFVDKEKETLHRKLTGRLCLTKDDMDNYRRIFEGRIKFMEIVRPLETIN